MIAISYSDFIRYGCPSCGCDFAVGGNCSGGGTSSGTCEECTTQFLILSDDSKKSAMGFGVGEDENGKTIFEYPELSEHPRKGIPWHPYIWPDPKPEYGEYWSPRGIGYDLSGFVRSKEAGKRLLEIVKVVLGNEKPDSWLDYRKREPKWIQFKFQKNEFDLKKLDKMACDNGRILTKEILIECRLKNGEVTECLKEI